MNNPFFLAGVAMMVLGLALSIRAMFQSSALRASAADHLSTAYQCGLQRGREEGKAIGKTAVEALLKGLGEHFAQAMVNANDQEMEAIKRLLEKLINYLDQAWADHSKGKEAADGSLR